MRAPPVREAFSQSLFPFRLPRKEETPTQLLQELRADRRVEAFHLVHAIRGITGNLGGNELEAAAAELEKACQAAGKGVPFALGEPLRVFIDRHGALLTAIGNVLVKQPVVAPVKPEGTQGDERTATFAGAFEEVPVE